MNLLCKNKLNQLYNNFKGTKNILVAVNVNMIFLLSSANYIPHIIVTKLGTGLLQPCRGK